MTITTPDSRAAGPSWIDRAVAIGFAIGGTAHGVSFVLARRGIYLYGAGYPAWRHAVMSTIDAAIVVVGLRTPRWLPVAVALFALEQAVVIGISQPFTILAAVAFAALLWQRRTR